MGYTSQYPTAHSNTYVKATTDLGPDYRPYFGTDPALSLTGIHADVTWYSASAEVTNQRFHIDLGSAKYIRRIYYENNHHSGGLTNRGVQNFTFWGSNTGAGSFDDLVYANDEGWTQLTIAQSTFDIHVSADQADPKYIVVTNTTAYRYYAFKFADNYGDTDYMGVRHVVLQTEDGYSPLISTAAIATSITGRLTKIMDLISTSTIATSSTSRITKIIQIVSASIATTSITATLSRGITAVLVSTSAITTSLLSSLSRGVKEVLTSTSNIATSITGSLSRGIVKVLTSTLAITTSITGRLTRIVDLVSTSAITTSIAGRLSRIIALISTSTITTSTTAALSRGITQALTSVADIVLSITAKFPHWLKKPAPVTAWTKKDDPTTTWTKEE